MVIDILDALDTYIYPLIIAIAWNFFWTMKLKGVVYGDDKDPTHDGLLVRVDGLENEDDK